MIDTNVTLSQALTTLGETIRHKRKKHKLTQVELSSKTGVSLTSIKNLEAGKPIRTDNLLRIAGYFHLVEEFINVFYVPEKSPQEVWESLNGKK